MGGSIMKLYYVGWRWADCPKEKRTIQDLNKIIYLLTKFATDNYGQTPYISDPDIKPMKVMKNNSIEKHSCLILAFKDKSLAEAQAQLLNTTNKEREKKHSTGMLRDFWRVYSSDEISILNYAIHIFNGR